MHDAHLQRISLHSGLNRGQKVQKTSKKRPETSNKRPKLPKQSPENSIKSRKVTKTSETFLKMFLEKVLSFGLFASV